MSFVEVVHKLYLKGQFKVIILNLKLFSLRLEDDVHYYKTLSVLNKCNECTLVLYNER